MFPGRKAGIKGNNLGFAYEYRIKNLAKHRGGYLD